MYGVIHTQYSGQHILRQKRRFRSQGSKNPRSSVPFRVIRGLSQSGARALRSKAVPRYRVQKRCQGTALQKKSALIRAFPRSSVASPKAAPRPPHSKAVPRYRTPKKSAFIRAFPRHPWSLPKRRQGHRIPKRYQGTALQNLQNPNPRLSVPFRVIRGLSQSSARPPYSKAVPRHRTPKKSALIRAFPRHPWPLSAPGP